MASELALPQDLLVVYPLFHVSMLRRYIPDESHVIIWDSIQLVEPLSFVKEHVFIIAWDVGACILGLCLW